MKLILFDIDGTLLWTDGAGRRAMEGALHAVFGSTGSPTYGYDGKTDLQIVREQMRHSGHEDVAIDAGLPRVIDEYLERLEGELQPDRSRAQRFDGVLELLDALEARQDRILGLLTGNVAQGAARKLVAAGIEPRRFRVGAYGSDHEHRHELPAVAMRRAHESLGVTVPGERLVIVGDTPSDIRCGRGVGARAIAVATGRYSVDELAQHAPAAVFRDLSATDDVLRAIDDA
jgi:phosphoglycolate phosphatase